MAVITISQPGPADPRRRWPGPPLPIDNGRVNSTPNNQSLIAECHAIHQGELRVASDWASLPWPGGDGEAEAEKASSVASTSAEKPPITWSFTNRCPRPSSHPQAQRRGGRGSGRRGPEGWATCPWSAHLAPGPLEVPGTQSLSPRRSQAMKRDQLPCITGLAHSRPHSKRLQNVKQICCSQSSEEGAATPS